MCLLTLTLETQLCGKLKLYNAVPFSVQSQMVVLGSQNMIQGTDSVLILKEIRCFFLNLLLYLRYSCF